MAKSNLDPMVTYYQRELNYLRRASSDFSKRYPKIAARLEISESASPDPHVERLLESFAYLTARIQRDIDDKFPRISSAILSVMYPHFVDPVPPMAIACFEYAKEKGMLTSSYQLAKGEKVFSRSAQNIACQFRTCYPVEIWPIMVKKAEIISTDNLGFSHPSLSTTRSLRILIETTAKSMGDLNIKKLRFYLNGDRATQNMLYEMFFADNCTGIVKTDQGNTRAFSSVTQVGFNRNEEVIPTAAASHPSYRLLTEYFNFPEKFLFIDVNGIEANGAEKTFEIIFSIPDKVTYKTFSVDSKNFLLGCTPIVNLFSKTSEPIKHDNKTTEYRLVADMRNERVTEIHSIESVIVSSAENPKPRKISQYFGFDHYQSKVGSGLFWAARRAPAIMPGIPGTDVQISFVDFNFDPVSIPDDVIYANVLCTNRQLARQMPARAVLQSDLSIPAKMYCLDKPTASAYPPRDGDTQWRLISQMSLNHLSLASNAVMLKEMLRLYAHLTKTRIVEEIQMIDRLESRKVVRRFMDDAWRGFAQGTHIDLSLLPGSFGVKGGLLFAAVLNEFFALYSAVNSFSELAVKEKDSTEVWKQWPANTGKKFLL